MTTRCRHCMNRLRWSRGRLVDYAGFDTCLHGPEPVAYRDHEPESETAR